MEGQAHKAHRAPQSGAKAEKKSKSKGKEKQHGFNEKVCRRSKHSLCISLFMNASRPLHQGPGGERRDRVVAR